MKERCPAFIVGIGWCCLAKGHDGPHGLPEAAGILLPGPIHSQEMADTTHDQCQACGEDRTKGKCRCGSVGT